MSRGSTGSSSASASRVVSLRGRRWSEYLSGSSRGTAHAIARHAIHYADPRLCDDTPTETTAYNERCREIAREMYYIMSEVRRQMDGLQVAARP